MFKQAQDPGLGEKYFKHTKRIINKDQIETHAVQAERGVRA